MPRSLPWQPCQSLAWLMAKSGELLFGVTQVQELPVINNAVLTDRQVTDVIKMSSRSHFVRGAML
ncbi:hypothetical protein PSPTOT1_5339 [Pseudomonas syringae pv. tomato T1]|nr:hypothetical protein PSPTOT1_5339 [Pseudomonas syringae pv. tomato T1]